MYSHCVISCNIQKHKRENYKKTSERRREFEVEEKETKKTNQLVDLYDLFLSVSLSEGIVPIGTDTITFFDSSKVHKMRGTVHFVVEFFGVGQVKFVLHVWIVTNTL